RVETLVDEATLAVRDIQVLQAPHIAEADDAVMTRMEKEMADLLARARASVKALSELAPPNAPGIETALKALDEFKTLSDDLVTLSRRNTTVKSLELSLGSMPPLTIVCDGRLQALQDALAAEGSKATR